VYTEVKQVLGHTVLLTLAVQVHVYVHVVAATATSCDDDENAKFFKVQLLLTADVNGK
jgi:hypothetical protein